MQGILQGFAGSFLLSWTSGRLRTALPVLPGIEVGLVSYGLFLALLIWAAGSHHVLVGGLLAATVSIVAWAGVLRLAHRESSQAMIVGDALGAAGLVFMGLQVPFLTDPSGGYVYLRSAAAPLTWAWLVTFAGLLKLANRLPGLFAGVTAMLSYLLLGSLLYQQQHTPEAFRMLAVVAGVTTGMWLNAHQEGTSRLGRISCSLWAITLGATAVLSTSKKVATVAVLSPVGLGLAPLAFFSFVIFRSYFLPRLMRTQEQRVVIRVGLDRDRIVGVLLLFCLLVNVLTLLWLFAPSGVWLAGLALLASLVFLRVAALVLRADDVELGPPGPRVEVLGVGFRRWGFDRHLDEVRRWLADEPGRPHRIITPDSLALLRSLEDPEYGAALRAADAVLPDGAGVIWAADFLHERPLLERIPGVEFVQRMMDLAQREGASVFLLGATDEVLAEARRAFAERWPRLELAGTHHGYFSAEEAEEVAARVRDSGASICLVAMGVPRQERFMRDHGEATGATVLMGVGGSLDVLSGNLDRAPVSYQSLGLEWLYRTLREPWRLSRIYHLPRFVLRVLEAKAAGARAATPPAE